MAAQRASGATKIALAILLSRIIGVVREQALAYYFGIGAHADVFRMALRAPNFLQNLLGEGTLSAAFIPLYSQMIRQGKAPEARRLAGAVLGLLLAAVGALTLLGLLFARPLMAVLAMGFTFSRGAQVDRFELAVSAVRIVFPMAAFLVLSSWTLGILNSHRRFFLPYFSPVLWNAAIIAALAVGARWLSPSTTSGTTNLLLVACWGALLGGVLQFLVQLPSALRELGGLQLAVSTRIEGVRQVLSSFGPVVAGRGVVQISGYFDYFLASFLAMGAVSVLGYAQVLYLLPISLFGMSVAASELPELSGLSAEGSFQEVQSRIQWSLRKVAFLSVPTLAGYCAFGYLIVGALFDLGSGKFGPGETWLVYLVLAAYALGLLASTFSRLLQNTFYALGQSKLPAKVASIRVFVSTALAIPLMLWLDRYTLSRFLGSSSVGRDLYLGAIGLGLGASVGAWFELTMLLRSLRKSSPIRIAPFSTVGRPALLSFVAALAAAFVWLIVAPAAANRLTAVVVLAVYISIYFLLGAWLAKEELSAWLGRRSAKVG